jgi:hypothetical protein
MMKKIRLSISLLVAILCFSCEKDIILDIQPGSEDTVVEAWIYDNSGPLVMLTKQFSGYGTFDLATLQNDITLRNATVFVSENNGTPIQLFEQSIFNLPQDLIEQVLDANRIPREFAANISSLRSLTLEQQLSSAENSADSALLRLINSFNFYMDTTNTIIGQPGSTYQLNIDVEGKNVTTETTLPLRQDINFLSYDIDQDNPDFAQVKVNFTVPNNFNALVLFATKRNSEPFYIPEFLDGGLSDNGIYAGGGALTLPLFRGYAENADVDVSELGLFEVGDTVTLKWQNIDVETYNFWFSIFNDRGDTPTSTAALIQTNVNNGFGIFGGYTTSYTTIIIQ